MASREQIAREKFDVLAPRIVKALQRRGFEAFYEVTSEKALERILSLIPQDSSIAWGGSMTLNEIGLLKALKNKPYQLIDRDQGKTQSEKTALMRQAFSADFYLSSVNAMTENGVLVNIDGTGNRVAAIAYGPKNVILVVGRNKVCATLDAAKVRAQSVAAPLNAFRLKMDLPCTKAGFCAECQNPQSICAIFVETHFSRTPGRIKVILVGDELGL